MRIRVVRRLSVLALSILFVISGTTLVVQASPEDAEDTVFTLTTENDFSNAETMWNVDATSDPGSVSLTPSPTDWIKLNEEVSLAARMPSPRFYSPAIWGGDFAYVFGGEDGVPVNLDEILRYDPTTRTSKVLDSVLPAPGGQMSVIWDGTVAYMFGGTTQGGGSPRDHIVKYEPSTDTITVMTEVLPSPRYSTAAIWTGSEAIIFGGTDNHVVFDDILRYDPLLDEISYLSSKLPCARYDASAGWDGSNAFIFGGQRGSLFLDEIVKYVPATDTVTLMSTRLPWGLAQASLVFDGRFFYILGGQTSTESIDSILRYDPSSDSIQVMDATLPTGRHATGAVWTGDKALIFGGWPYPMDEVIEYAPYTNPVLTVGQPGSWDDYAVGSPSVLKEGSLYKMWYEGVSYSTRWRWKIGYAESSNGLTWTKNSIPVFAPDPASPWENYGIDRPQVLKVGNTYKMWYNGYGDLSGRTNRIGYAESSNGIDWTRVSSTPVLELGAHGEWDGVATWKTFVKFENGIYRMWYSGHNGVNCKSSIGYAESVDGISWTRYPSNPILSPQGGSWEGIGIEVSHVEKIGNQYVMWYNRHCPPEAIGVAVSPDGLSWTKYLSNPVLEKGDSDSWDNKGVTWVSILREADAMKMWYSGDHTSKNWGLNIGLAIATFKSQFFKSPSDPVIDMGPPGSWDDYAVGSPSVLKDGSLYKVWYEGVNYSTRWHFKIGYAESPDGLTWTKMPAPVFEPDPASPWENYGIDRPQVLKVGNTYKMWYNGYRDSTGFTNRIGYAESSNGIDWIRVSSTPVLELGAPGEWDSVATWKTFVMFENGMYRMWYSGHDGINCHSHIGYASSSDGISWIRHPENPILEHGVPGQWDDRGIEVSHVEKIGGLYVMFYNKHCPPEAVGIATSYDGLQWTKYARNPVLSHGSPGDWDDKGVTWVSIIQEDNALRIWYTGDSTTGNWRIRIGHASSQLESIGLLVSKVIDSRGTTWKNIAWDAEVPANTMLSLSVRTGPSPVPDDTWTDWSAEVRDSNEFDVTAPDHRYLQYRATFASMDGRNTPVLEEVRLGYYLHVTFDLRISGAKWKNIDAYLYEDGAVIGHEYIVREEGGNEVTVTLADLNVDYSKLYSFTANFTPEEKPNDGPFPGGTSAMLVMRYNNAVEIIHHTFSGSKPETWIWTIDDLNQYFPRPEMLT